MIERLKSALGSSSGDGAALKAAGYRDRFESAMDEDFNTPMALAVIFDLARDINRESTNGLDVEAAQKLLCDLGKVLGLTLKGDDSGFDGNLAPFIDLLLDIREGLRKEKQFELSDRIRDRLDDLGVSIEDTVTGARWKLD